MFDLEKFLQDKEDRYYYQKKLVQKYKQTLLTIRTNYPGENKRDILADKIADIMADEIESIFFDKIIFKDKIESLEGKIYLYILNEDARKIKLETMEIEENHILGRCLDIDVYDNNYNALSRKDFNLGKRQCMLCDKLAFVCAREKNHSQEEIKSYILKKYIEYKEYEIKREQISSDLLKLSLKGMIYEVGSYPSFGLVSPLTNGSHNDMNFFTFLDSSFIISEGFKKMAKIGYSYLNYDKIFKKIREIGKETEKNMFKATGNVNTHKGMIFLLGISIAATAKAKYENKDFNGIKKILEIMTFDILDDFENIKNLTRPLTHGEKLFLEHGFTGIRGEIKNGLDIIFNGSLQVYSNMIERGFDFNKTAVQTLIYLMSKVMDSTIVYRHNFEMLEKVKMEMNNIYLAGGIEMKESENIFNEIEKRYISQRISPGGSADLLAITIFFYNLLETY